ncbi:IS66 family transposase [Escherichia coli]
MNNTLPDDIEQLKALLIAQQAVIVRLPGEITGYAREISSLRALVAKLQRMLFGRSSEKSREKIEKKIARAETRITELQNRLGEAQLQLTSMAGETAPKTSDSPDRKGIHPQQHLADYRGILQADAYAGYNALYESGQVTEAACMAHARRKIHDVHARAPTDITTEALQRIGELYAIEAEIRGSPAEERLAVRKARTVPLMQSLYEWLQGQMSTLSRHSDTAKAFTYLLKQWDALNEYCRNGWVEIDNNLCENALRVVALGRRNYMFFGSDGGGESAAVMYSLIGSCKLNGIEPETWLRHVISVINTWPANRVKELLPWNVTQSVN